MEKSIRKTTKETEMTNGIAKVVSFKLVINVSFYE